MENVTIAAAGTASAGRTDKGPAVGRKRETLELARNAPYLHGLASGGRGGRRIAGGIKKKDKFKDASSPSPSEVYGHQIAVCDSGLQSLHSTTTAPLVVIRLMEAKTVSFEVNPQPAKRTDGSSARPSLGIGNAAGAGRKMRMFPSTRTKTAVGMGSGCGRTPGVTGLSEK